MKYGEEASRFGAGPPRFIAQPGFVLTDLQTYLPSPYPSLGLSAESARYRLQRLVAVTPEITASDAARLLDVTRQRIHQLARSLGITMTRAHKPGVKRYCPCTRELSRKTVGTVCAKCRNKMDPLFCSDCGVEVNPSDRWNARNKAVYPTGQYTGRVFCARICPTMRSRTCPCGQTFLLNYYQRSRVRHDPIAVFADDQYQPRCPECRVKGAACGARSTHRPR